jgi:hypothetical protein
MAWTTPKTWIAGSVLTAAEMNTHVRDNLSYLYDQIGGATGFNQPNYGFARQSGAAIAISGTAWQDAGTSIEVVRNDTTLMQIGISGLIASDTAGQQVALDIQISGSAGTAQVGGAFDDGLHTIQFALPQDKEMFLVQAFSGIVGGGTTEVRLKARLTGTVGTAGTATLYAGSATPDVPLYLHAVEIIN